MEKISLTRLLAKIKMYNKRLAKVQFSPALLAKGNKELVELSKENETCLDELTSYTSIYDNTNNLKIVLNDANNTTKFDAGPLGKISIAQAIIIKNNVDKLVIINNQLKGELATAQYHRDEHNENLNAKIERLMSSKASSGSNDKKFISEITNSLNSIEKAAIVNEDKIKEKIEELQKDIDFIKDELDMYLSEVNASTFVEVES
jgi:hypothetical protein